MKWCPKCKKDLPLASFGPDKRHSNGLKSRCRKCLNEESKNYAKKHPPDPRKVRCKNLRQTYGISADEFDAILDRQGGCAICGKTYELKKMHVDHDHSCCPGYGSCGKCVRSILCHKCNWAIAGFDENIEILKKAIAYLEDHSRVASY